MISVSAVMVLMLALTAEATVGDSSQLDFCSETNECFLFDLICKTDDYEVRHYKSVKWVSTNETSFLMEFAAMKTFRRLYNYIQGANEKGKKIEMTAPVVMRIPDKGFLQTGEYRMSFLLPAEYQADPPKPIDNEDKVYIYETKDMNVYVRSYGGWLTTISDGSAAKSLSSALDSAGAKYKKGGHDAAGYNSPMTLFQRHNEVWFEADGELPCTGLD